MVITSVAILPVVSFCLLRSLLLGLLLVERFSLWYYLAKWEFNPVKPLGIKQGKG
jgi:hypothetical protein